MCSAPPCRVATKPCLTAFSTMRLQEQRRHAEAANRRRHVDRDLEPFFEPRTLDLEVRPDQVDFLGKRGELGRRATQHAPQNVRQAQERIDGAGRRGLDQIANRRQGIEEKVGVELGAKRPQLGFGREALHPLLAHVPLEPLVRDAKRVDSPSALLRDGLEEPDIVGEEATARGQRPERDRAMRAFDGLQSQQHDRSGSRQPRPELRPGRDDPTIGDRKRIVHDLGIGHTEGRCECAVEAENDARPQSRPRPGRATSRRSTAS